MQNVEFFPTDFAWQLLKQKQSFQPDDNNYDPFYVEFPHLTLKVLLAPLINYT